MSHNLTLPVFPLTHSAWAPYGVLLQGTSDVSSLPSNITTKTTTPYLLPTYKQVDVSPILATHPPEVIEGGKAPIPAISILRIGPPAGAVLGGPFEIRMLERHAYSTQAFLPLAKSGPEWEKFSGRDEVVDTPGVGGMLVAACLNDKETDKPDLSTLKVFLAAPNQGVSYNVGTWHHTVISFAYTDYALIDVMVRKDGSLKSDLEIVRAGEGEEPFAVVMLPSLV